MEKKYYYIDSKGNQFGPLTANELIGAGITPTTYIWRSGLSEWLFAKDLPEIAQYLQAAPPTCPSQPQSVPQPQPVYPQQQYNGYNQNYAYDNEPIPSSYLGWSIAATLLCCLPTGIVAIIYASQVSSKWAAGDREGARRSASTAKTWFWVSVCAGLFFNILYLILYLVFGFAYGISSLLYL